MSLHDNLSSMSQAETCARTDRHDESTRSTRLIIYQFYKRPIKFQGASIIMTSVEGHFAPLHATAEGLVLILVPDNNICLHAQGETVPESRIRRLIAGP